MANSIISSPKHYQHCIFAPLIVSFVIFSCNLFAQTKPRARDLGIPLDGTPGPNNAITDVAGVEVGFTTLISGEGKLVVGKGPVMITNTHSVGVVRDAVVEWQYKNKYYDALNLRDVFWALPVVAETYDGGLSDINGFHVKKEHVFAALDQAKTDLLTEGNVGGGAGMVCHGFKGGAGTASRKLSERAGGYTVGVLVQSGRKIKYAFELYEEMVEAWLVREEGIVEGAKGKKEALRQFLERLAVDLYVNKEQRRAESIPAGELTAPRKFFWKFSYFAAYKRSPTID